MTSGLCGGSILGVQVTCAHFFSITAKWYCATSQFFVVWLCKLAILRLCKLAILRVCKLEILRCFAALLFLASSSGVVMSQPETSNTQGRDENDENPPQDPPLNNNPPLADDETASLPLTRQDIPAIVSAVMAAAFPKAKAPTGPIQPSRSAKNSE